MGLARGRFGQDAFHAIFGYNQHLTRRHIPHIFCIDKVQGACFGCNHISRVQSAEAKGTKTVGIPHGNDGIFGHENHGKGPLDLTHCMDQGRLQAVFHAFCYEMKDNLTIHSCLKDRSAVFQVSANLTCIDQVAVVGYCQSLA